MNKLARMAITFGFSIFILSVSKTSIIRLDEMENTNTWATQGAEVKLSLEKKTVYQGKGALKFNVIVDHNTGNNKYLKGWPRIYRRLKKSILINNGDKVQFMVYCKSNRKKMPFRPIYISFKNNKKLKDCYFSNILTKNKWQKITMKIRFRKRINKASINFLSFVISEKNYNHYDSITFYLDDVKIIKK